MKKFNHAFDISQGTMCIPMRDVEELLKELNILGLSGMRTVVRLQTIFNMKMDLLN